MSDKSPPSQRNAIRAFCSEVNDLRGVKVDWVCCYRSYQNSFILEIFHFRGSTENPANITQTACHIFFRHNPTFGRPFVLNLHSLALLFENINSTFFF